MWESSDVIIIIVIVIIIIIIFRLSLLSEEYKLVPHT